VDRARWPARERERHDPAFIAHWHQLCWRFKGERRHARAHRELARQWRAGEAIPGLADFAPGGRPGPLRCATSSAVCVSERGFLPAPGRAPPFAALPWGSGGWNHCLPAYTSEARSHLLSRRLVLGKQQAYQRGEIVSHWILRRLHISPNGREVSLKQMD
jgi:hypothetical protein